MFVEVLNDDFDEEMRRIREKKSHGFTYTADSPVFYVLHGGGMFVLSPLQERFMFFFNLEQTINSHIISASRDRFFSMHGGFQRNEQLSLVHNLRPDLSNITQEQIDTIRNLGGAVSLSRAAPFSLPQHFYFVSNAFQVANA